MASAIKSRSKKIGGYDTWDVEEGVRTMRRAGEIEADEKFLKVVVAEMGREANKLEDKANLLVETQVKLDKVYKKDKNNGDKIIS